MMFTLYKVKETLEVVRYRVRGTVYRDMVGEIMVNFRLK